MQELTYKIAQNAMEYLVTEEIERQIKLYPKNRREDLDLHKDEIAIYALNRLPVLYSSSEQELIFQIEKAKQTYLQQVRQLVNRGFIALKK